MVETSGTTIYDYSRSGISVATAAISFAPFPHTNAVEVYSGVNIGTAPTTGVMPNPGTSDYIFFVVGNYRSAYALGRADTQVRIGNDATGAFGVGDGDAAGTYTGSAANVTCDTFVGGLANDNSKFALGSVRSGRKFGNWLHVVNGEHSSNSKVGTGDIFCDTPLNNHVTVNGVKTSTEFVSDYAPSIDPTVTYTSYSGIGDTSGGFPGIWAKADPGYSVPYTNTMRIGLTSGPVNLSVAYYGIALFVFQNGLPQDWKDALRWMRDQWFVGNKALWPAWKGLS